MTLSDYFLTSLSNIRKNRLRSLLTIVGVAVAIGALTSMMSFGIGLQGNFNEAIKKNRLISKITVLPKESDGKKLPVTDSIITIISKIDGVESVFKENRIPTKIIFNNTDKNTTIKTIPYTFNKYFTPGCYLAGGHFESDSSHSLIITESFIKELVKNSDSTLKDNIEKIDSILPTLIGTKITVSVITIDMSIMSNMFTAMATLMSNKLPFRDSLITFTISGIVELGTMSDFGTGVYITETVAQKIPQMNFENIWDLLDKKDVSMVQAATVYTTGIKETESVTQQIKNMGYNARSILDEMKELKQLFYIMDSILGAIGIMALFIATLGLVNTLIMSIYERTREIGILKSLGAGNWQIRKLFIIEAGCIGLIGAIIGIPLGWAVTELIDAILFSTLFRDVQEEIILFSFPWFLIIGAIIFSTIFSILAGLYPAVRASKVDPVKALRHE
ncbi:MAG: FtsX-like permease family protein [Bacteroidales bacterium]|nr:FtsX-like permease family protein [Bacteroidales bacterium]